MASSPDRGSGDGEVRWPLVARIGVALAVLTVVVGIVAAVVAAFVVDREDEPSSVVGERSAQVFPIAV